MEFAASDALGIGAASFCSEAEKDIAESPTAIAGTPPKKGILKLRNRGIHHFITKKDSTALAQKHS